jgi:serine protease Do
VVARIARDRASSVVLLHTLSAEPTPQDPPVLPPIEEALGSGVVVDANGLVLTNAHVVAHAGVIHVRTPDGDDLKATLLGTDPDTDLAVLRVPDARGLRPAPLGDSGRLQVGEWVVAIGSPLGLHHTVTVGVVSAKARTVDDSGLEFIQTDAAINPGSSGGPLFDLSGAVVGINSGMLSGRGQNVGLNVAIPISIVKEVLPHLVQGAVVHGWIGIATSVLTRDGARARGLHAGLVVMDVTENGPADRAGIHPKDIIVGVADQLSMPLQDFYRHVRRTATGTLIRLQVWRDNERLELPVEVGRRPPLDR